MPGIEFGQVTDLAASTFACRAIEPAPVIFNSPTAVDLRAVLSDTGVAGAACAQLTFCLMYLFLAFHIYPLLVSFFFKSML